MNQFQIIANNTSKLFSKEEFHLDFSGYNDFLETYRTTSNYDSDSLNDVIKESLLWNDYISEIINTVNILIFSYAVDYEAIKSGYSSRDQLHLISEKVTMLKMLKKELYLQKKLCMSIYYDSMKHYEKSMNAFSINDYINSYE